MGENAIVEFRNENNQSRTEIEIPLQITANELVLALKEAFQLEIDAGDIFNCYLVSENPIAFLRGNRTLKEFGIHNGSILVYKREEDGKKSNGLSI